MNLRLTQIALLLLILSSCKSLQRLSSRDNAKQAVASGGDTSPQSIDPVNIAPGGKSSAFTYERPIELNSKKSFSANTSFNLEKADWLQIKYAILMDMPVEQLNNLPLLKQIDHWWGTRYCLGGDDENCIDCSAFTQTILRMVYGVDVPRTAKEQFRLAKHVDNADIKEGDLVFFRTGRSITHVGLYIGNYKFVHSATSTGVAVTDLSDSYWGRKYVGAGRVM